MNTLSRVEINDCTLLEAENHFELSFREKIELCRLIDRLGVSAIELAPIRHPKIDRLLVKSISSAVQHAALALPVHLGDLSSVTMAWEALREARKPRLQVISSVSSVQMEYLMHMKPAAVLAAIGETVRACRELTEDVEFVAQDATRSDSAFLLKALSAALEAGAGTITLCDTAGVLMPEEIYQSFTGLYEQLPALHDVRVGFCCAGDLNMADACAFSAVRAGVREIKAITCQGNAVSLSNITRILELKGSSLGITTGISREQLRRITDQVESICHGSDRKTPSGEASPREAEEILNLHDSRETVLKAVEKLGYDLSREDQEKIWTSFVRTAERKEQLTLKELDAIIAAEAMQAPPAYHSIQYVINTGNQISAMAHMKLHFHDQELEGIATGDGAISAAFNSIEKATGRHFELDDFQIRSVTEGREAMGETVVRLRWNGRLYSGRGISTDIVGAGIMAYLNAVNKIVYEEEEA